MDINDESSAGRVTGAPNERLAALFVAIEQARDEADSLGYSMLGIRLDEALHVCQGHLEAG